MYEYYIIIALFTTNYVLMNYTLFLNIGPVLLYSNTIN